MIGGRLVRKIYGSSRHAGYRTGSSESVTVPTNSGNAKPAPADGKKQHMRMWRSEYMKKYRQRPEAKARNRARMRICAARPENRAKNKEYQREYAKRPAVRARLAAWRAIPEVRARCAAYNKEYYMRPESRAYRESPEGRKKMREYSRTYLSKPGVRARRKKYQRDYKKRPEVIARARARRLKTNHI